MDASAKHRSSRRPRPLRGRPRVRRGRRRAGGGVVVRWVPRARAAHRRLTSSGAAFDASALRGAITERVGASPSHARGEIVASCARITPNAATAGARVDVPLHRGRTPELVALTLAIVRRAAGPSSAVRRSAVSPPSRKDGDRASRRGSGLPFDDARANERVAAFEDHLREQGHYEARSSPRRRLPTKTQPSISPCTSSAARRCRSYSPVIRCPKTGATPWSRSARSAASISICSRTPAATSRLSSGSRDTERRRRVRA